MIKLINIALELFVKDIFTFRTFLTRRQNCLNFMSLNTSSRSTTPILHLYIHSQKRFLTFQIKSEIGTSVQTRLYKPNPV